jgi:hypothetical protein
VQCTRKTEVRSWKTLFAHLPTPQELFEESLEKGTLKTAGGYLLVLHTLDELGSSSQQLIRLLRRAKDEMDWELCKDLARFLMALDESGDTLRAALAEVDLAPQPSGADGAGDDNDLISRTSRLSMSNGTSVGLGIATRLDFAKLQGREAGSQRNGEGDDYFSQ